MFDNALAFVLVHSQQYQAPPVGPAFSKEGRWAIWGPSVDDVDTLYYCPSAAQTPPRDGWEAEYDDYEPAPTVLLSARDRDEIREGRKIRGTFLKPPSLHTLFVQRGT